MNPRKQGKPAKKKKPRPKVPPAIVERIETEPNSEPTSKEKFGTWLRRRVLAIFADKVVGWLVFFVLLMAVSLGVMLWNQKWEFPQRAAVLIGYFFDGEIGFSDIITGLIGRGDFRAKRVAVPLTEGRYVVEKGDLVVVIDLPDETEERELITIDDRTGEKIRTGKLIFKVVEVRLQSQLGDIGLFATRGEPIEYWQPKKPQHDTKLNCSVEVEWFVPSRAGLADCDSKKIVIFTVKTWNIDATRPPCPL